MMINIVKFVVYRLFYYTLYTFMFGVGVFYFFGVYPAIAVCVVGVTGILYNAQDILLYHPYDPPDSRDLVMEPSNYNLPYESIKIKNDDGIRIHLFLIKQANSNNVPTMIFFHGNAGNMGQRLANVSGLYHKLNINILMVEYRGYGMSEGSPSESGLYCDAQAALDYAHRRSDIDRSKIFLFGRSLGGAVAIDLASHATYRHKIWALVVENTFTSVPHIAKIVLRWRLLRCMPAILHKNKYMSLKKMSNVTSPTLVICGSNDTLVPPIMATRLFKACRAVVKKLAVFPGGGHNDTWTCRDYYSTIKQYLLTVPSLPESAYFDAPVGNEVLELNAVHTV